SGFVECGLEGPRIDGEHEIALLHELSVLEMHGDDITRDARPQIDSLDRLELSYIVVPIRNLLDERLRDGNLGQLRYGGGGLRFLTPVQEYAGEGEDRRETIREVHRENSLELEACRDRRLDAERHVSTDDDLFNRRC